MFEGRKPILFFRQADGDVLMLLRCDNENVEKLGELAKDHVFDVHSYEDILVVEQGDAWEKVPETFRDVNPEEETSGIGAFTTSLIMSGMAKAKENAKGTIKPSQVRKLGLEPVSNIRAFYDEDFNDTDHDIARKIAATGFKNLDAAMEVNSVWVNYVLRDHLFKSGKSKLSGLHFDEDMVFTNLVAYKVRGLHSNGARGKFMRYRKENCSRCVFPCYRPPWNLTNPRPVTEEQILDEYRPDDDQKRWMSLFTICGQSGKFVNERSGRRRDGIGAHPERTNDGLQICVLSKRPPYEELNTISVEEYWEGVRRGEDASYARTWLKDGHCLTETDEKVLAYTNWALQALMTITSHHEATFSLDNHRGPSRNDILYIRLWSSCREIEIGSDTKATNYGGMNYKGDPIPVWNRPRFKTHYTYPFADSIWNWFAETPGACRGSKK